MPRLSGVPGVLRAHPLVAVAIAVATSVALSGLYLIWQPQTLDLAAQTYRADLWESDGWVIWSPGWYGGFTVPGYSLLYPPLGALLGPALLGALSAVAAAALFGSVALRAFGERAWLGVVWFGFASVVALYGGRITFALGLALGLATVLAIQRDRRLLAVVAGAATSLASPVAGLFALLAATAVVGASLLRRRDPKAGAGALPVAAAAAAIAGAGLALGALGVAFPTEGYQPFALSAFVWIPVVVLAIWLLAPPEQDVLRVGAALYLALGLFAFAIHTPVGSNAVRLGWTFAGPLLALLVVRRRPLVLVLVAIPLLYWQWTATVRDIVAAEGDPSTEVGYYGAIKDRLAREGLGSDERVHIPATRNRWESVYIAEQVPIDGGWLRQLEPNDSEFLNQSGLTAASYLRWLQTRGVSYLIVNDAEPDAAAERERALVDSDSFPLEPVWEDSHWRLYDLDPGPAKPPIRSGDGKLAEVTSDGFFLKLRSGSSVDLALRYSPYFEVTAGSGCVERVEGDNGAELTRVSGTADPAGLGPKGNQVVRVQPRLSIGAALRRDRSCADLDPPNTPRFPDPAHKPGPADDLRPLSSARGRVAR